MTDRPPPLRSLADRNDALLHYIPLLRKAVVVMVEDDPQKHEDDHVKEIKQRTETQTGNGR